MICNYLISFAIVALCCQAIHGDSGDGFQKDVGAFSFCNGKQTNAGQFAQAKLPTMATCLTGVSRPKYCQYKCMVSKLGAIDGNGHVHYEAIESEFRSSNIFNEHTAEFVNQGKECVVEGKNYGSEDDHCRNFRELFYCVYNKFADICNKKLPKKDINHASEEAGVVKNTVSTADTAVGVVLN